MGEQKLTNKCNLPSNACPNSGDPSLLAPETNSGPLPLINDLSLSRIFEAWTSFSHAVFFQTGLKVIQRI